MRHAHWMRNTKIIYLKTIKRRMVLWRMRGVWCYCYTQTVSIYLVAPRWISSRRGSPIARRTTFSIWVTEGELDSVLCSHFIRATAPRRWPSNSGLVSHPFFLYFWDDLLCGLAQYPTFRWKNTSCRNKMESPGRWHQEYFWISMIPRSNNNVLLYITG